RPPCPARPPRPRRRGRVPWPAARGRSGRPSPPPAPRRPRFSPSPLDRLYLRQQGDDLLHRVAVVLDDLAGLALLGLDHLEHLFGGLAAGDAQVTQTDLFDLLAAGGHDALEGGVARLPDA